MAFIINRVHTGIGDHGTTRLAGGQEVDKTCARIEAYGTVDELNAVVGVLAERVALELPSMDRATATEEERYFKALRRIQNELFDLGGELATLPQDLHPRQVLISSVDAERLEREMDAETSALPALRSFILPGGGLVSALAHQARTVCRRAERRVLHLHEELALRDDVLKYLNRLSDWFFVMGRVSAVRRGQVEVLWQPGLRGT